MNLNDFKYTKPNKPNNPNNLSIDYDWFLNRVHELDNYYHESNSYNEIVYLDENLNSLSMGAYELAVPDRFIGSLITLVRLKDTWVAVYFGNDEIMYFFKENKELIYRLDGDKAISTNSLTAKDFYNEKIIDTLKLVLK